MKFFYFLCTSLIIILAARHGLGQGQFPVDNPPLAPATYTSSAPTAPAPEKIRLADEKYDGIPIVDIEISGNRNLTTEKILSFITTSTNRAFSSQVVQSDVRRLYRSGLIRNVRTFTRRVPEGIVVSFEVFERPTIEQVLYLGNRGISDKQLQNQTNSQNALKACVPLIIVLK